MIARQNRGLHFLDGQAEGLKVMPFFTFYGGKFRVAHKYPAPRHRLVVEPFAGSAGYALNYAHRDVLLIDRDENVVSTWDYLIRAPETEIVMLPDLEAGQDVDDLDVPPEARLLIGWWLNKGSAQPKRRPSSFMLNYPQGGPYWGERIRERIVRQQEFIRHWQVRLGDYRDVSVQPATWFVDPPYQRQGRHYRYSASGIDYGELATWCRSLPGQVIVCEADNADWLPFQHLAEIDGTEGRQKTARARSEVVWTSESMTVSP